MQIKLLTSPGDAMWGPRILALITRCILIVRKNRVILNIVNVVISCGARTWQWHGFIADMSNIFSAWEGEGSSDSSANYMQVHRLHG